jgi:site-specific recombinase XerD
MSALHNALAEYVAIRRALGAQLHEPARTLGHFVDFLEREGAGFITSALAVRWAREPSGVEPATWARRLGMVRRFAVWQSASDPRTEVPPKGLIRARRRRKTPYIFTDQQIQQLMTEASRLPSPTGLRSLTYTTLIGLLATTGLRPGEALRLDFPDVNLESGVLTVRQSKFGKTRFVPVEDSAHAALTRYAERRDELCPRRRSNAFLVSEGGTRLEPCTVRRTFAKLSQTIGLRKPMKGKLIGRGPRLQDLRHTFVTRRLLEWYRAGLDVERKMPGLATYVGHVDVAHTYWYVEAVPELLQLATDQLMASRQESSR